LLERSAMSAVHPDFAAVLLARQILGPEQLLEAWKVETSTGARLEDVLVRLGYASAEEIARARAQALGLACFDLDAVTIPQAVIELVPESVARENVVLPVALEGETLVVACVDPSDGDMLQKLQFILNKDIRLVVAPRERIVAAINRYYGQTETESV